MSVWSSRSLAPPRCATELVETRPSSARCCFTVRSGVASGASMASSPRSDENARGKNNAVVVDPRLCCAVHCSHGPLAPIT